MNTKQLIVLWYSGFILSIILLSFIPQIAGRDLIVSISILLIIVILLFLTFRENEKLNQKTILYTSILPISGLVIFFLGFLIIENNYNNEIPTNEIELFDENLQIESNSTSNQKITFKARVENKSKNTLKRLRIRIRVHEVLYQGPSNEDQLTDNELRLEEFIFFTGPDNRTHIDKASESIKENLGRIIDTQDLLWSGWIESGVTKSIHINERYTNLEPGRFWLWSYEIIEASPE